MTTHRRFRLVFVLGGVLILTGAEGLDPGELHCEEAVKHLADCCHTALDRAYDCTAGRSCETRRPDLDDPLATQVRDSSCDALIRKGACTHPPRSPVSGDLAVTDFARSSDPAARDLSTQSAAGDL